MKFIYRTIPCPIKPNPPKKTILPGQKGLVLNWKGLLLSKNDGRRLTISYGPKYIIRNYGLDSFPSSYLKLSSFTPFPSSTQYTSL